MNDNIIITAATVVSFAILSFNIAVSVKQSYSYF